MSLGFEIYKRKVVKQLEKAGYTGSAIEFAESLDMSYEDLIQMKVPEENWDTHIACDLVDYMADVPEDFKKH